MKINKFFGFFLVVVLVIGMVSAFWPFESITGNVVDGDVFDNSDTCEDTDGGFILDDAGMVAARSYWGKPKIYKDKCYPSKGAKNRYLSDGTRISARPKIREFYCEDGSMKYETLTSEDLGEGYCVYETKTLKGKNVKVAKWIPIEKACIELKPGNFRTELGKVFKTRCSGKNLYEYSCSDTDEILESVTNCPAKCSLKQGGCFGECTTEIDTDNDKDVPGSLLVDGEPILDQCAGTKAVKQYKCLNNGLKSLKAQGCGTNRICADSDAGSYCKDLYASADLTGTVGQTSGDLASLGVRVTALEGSVASRNQNVLNLLNGCTLQKSPGSAGTTASCNTICIGVSKTCVSSLVSDVKNFSGEIRSYQELAACNQDIVTGEYIVPNLGTADLSLTCICC